MTHQLTRIFRALGAATILIALLIGLPLVLLVWGRSPLEGPGSIADRLQEPLSDTMVFGLLTWTAWAAWVVFSLHVGIEIAAACGASRWRIPAFGPVGISARKLVTAITMSITLAGPLAQRGAATPMPQPIPTETVPVGSPSTNSSAPTTADVVIHTSPESSDADTHERQTDSAPPRSTSDETPAWHDSTTGAAEPVITVVPGDTPWGLAERHLGEGMRWREIWDRNRGVEQADGRAWVCEDLIYPGWQFRLPDDAHNLPQPAEPSTSGPAEEPAPPAPELPPEPSDTDEPPVTTDSTATPTTSVVESPQEPGETDTPGLPQAPEDSTPTTAPGTGPTTTTSTTTEPPPTTISAPSEPDNTDASAAPSDVGDEDEQQDESEAAPVVPLLGAAATLLSVGVLRQLRRRRSRVAVRRPLRRSAPRSPQPDIEREVLVTADEDEADRLDAALVHLATSLRPRPGQDCPQPLVVQVQGRRVDVCMDRPDPAPPAPWRPEASGLVWVLRPDKEIPGNLDTILPTPSLATIGTDGDANILVHLEAHGVVALTGDPEMCRRVARSMVTELSTRTEGTVSCMLIGEDLDDLGTAWDSVHRVLSWNDADTGIIGGSARLLDAANWPHTWAARASGRALDGWPPTIFFTTPNNDPQYRQALEAASTRPGTGSVILVIGDDPGCGLRIHIDSNGNFQCPQLRLTGTAQAVDEQITSDLSDLLEHADTPDEAQDDGDDDGLGDLLQRLHTTNRETDYQDDEDGPEPPIVQLDEFREPAPTPTTSEPTPTYDDPDWDVLVRVCGEITIDGTRSKLRPREKAVLAYIALNGKTDIDKLQDAIWAGAAVTLKRVQNVISIVRGSARDAIQLAGDGRITAGPGLTTDLELIQRRIDYASHQDDPRQRAETLRGGLALVTGKICICPPGGRRSWTWLDLDSWISHADRIVGTAAAELAHTYLTLEDCDGASWAANKGIEAIGKRDDLIVPLVRAHEMAGDEDAARDVIRNYEAWLADLGVDEHNEELLTLLERYAPPPGSTDHAPS